MITETEFEPIVGKMCSIKLKDNSYIDAIVKARQRGGYHLVIGVHDEIEYRVPDSIIEPPLSYDVNKRFEHFRDLAGLVVDKKLNALLVTGEGGIGKGYTLQEVLEVKGQVEDDHYVTIKGFSTARALFNALQENPDKLFILDDCDSVMNDRDAMNILKVVLDTYARRWVRWMAARDTGSSTGFQFTGSIIFLSNKNRDDIGQALLSRSLNVDLFMTEEEKISRMAFLLPTLEIDKSVTIEERQQVLQLIDKYKYTVGDLNIRTLLKAMRVFQETRSMDLVRYQVLNG